MAVRIKLRRDVNADWVADNPILAEGEIGIVTNAASDDVKMKIGDGTTAWNALSFFDPGNAGAAWGGITGTLSSQTDLQTALNLKAIDSAVVHLSGAETIAGVKTFSSIPVLPASSPFTDNEAVRKKYADDRDATNLAAANAYTDSEIDSYGNLQKAFKKINDIYNATSGATLNVGVFGDSVAHGKPYIIRTALTSVFKNTGSGMAGAAGIGMDFGSLTGGATANTTDFTNWINGRTLSVPSAGEAILAGSSVNSVYGNTLKLYYVKSSGAGTFKVQSSLAGAAFADEAGYTNVDASNGSTTAGVITITKTAGLYRLKVVGLTGTVVFIGGRIYDSTAYGIMFNDFSASGITVDNMNTCNSSILSVVMDDIGCDMAFFEAKETAATLITSLPTLLTNLDTAFNEDFGWVMVGSSPLQTNDADQVAQNVIIKDNAISRGDIYIDLHTPFQNYTKMLALGYTSDGIHLTTSGNRFAASLLLDRLFISTQILLPKWNAVPGVYFHGEPIFSYTTGGTTLTGTKNLISGRNDAVAIGGVLTKDTGVTYPAMHNIIGYINGINTIFGGHYTTGTDQVVRIASLAKTLSQSPVALIVLNNGSSSNVVSYGGGSSLLQMPTEHRFYATASINTTSAASAVKAVISSKGVHIGIDNTTPFLSSGTGTPESVVTAPIGSVFLRSDGGVSTSIYIKESGSGNTGWVGK